MHSLSNRYSGPIYGIVSINHIWYPNNGPYKESEGPIDDDVQDSVSKALDAFEDFERQVETLISVINEDRNGQNGYSADVTELNTFDGRDIEIKSKKLKVRLSRNKNCFDIRRN